MSPARHWFAKPELPDFHATNWRREMRDADQFEDRDFDVDLDVGDREERVVKVHTFDRFDNTFAELRYVLSHIGV
jgi:hypothetical protein